MGDGWIGDECLASFVPQAFLNSQLDVSLLKILKRVLAFSRRQSGRELGRLDISKQFDQEVKSAGDTDLLKPNDSCLKRVKAPRSPTCEQPVWSW